MSVYFIAEIGINHNGDMAIAKELIRSAQECGCNAVKFQKRTVDLCYTQKYLESFRESPWGTTQREQKEGLEFGLEEYQEIDRYCKELRIDWFASAWDLEAQSFLNQFDLKYNKVASAMLGHLELLKMIAGEGRHTYISTGMSTMEEIESAVNIFRDAKCPFELLHCNSTYPMKNEHANLATIKTLRDYFKCDVGYSGHETGRIVTVSAVAMGATSVERHVTLDKTMYGSDQAASIETKELSRLMDDIRTTSSAIGDGVKRIHEDELPIREKLRS